MPQFICTRYYSVIADDEFEAKEIFRNAENDIDFLLEEERKKRIKLILKHLEHFLLQIQMLKTQKLKLNTKHKQMPTMKYMIGMIS